MSVTAAGMVNKPNATNPSLYDFLVAVLEKLGVPATGPNVAVLSGLALSEGRGLSGWNPLDTELRSAGSTNFNSAGVQSYPSFQAGVDATAATLEGSIFAPFITGLREQAPLSYYVQGPGAVAIKDWQRGPNGPSNPPPAGVTVLASRTSAQLLAWAKMVAGGSRPPSPPANASLMVAVAPAGGGTSSAQLTSSSSDPNSGLYFGLGPAVTAAEQKLGQFAWLAVGAAVFAFGVVLIFAGDIEKAGEKIGDVVEKVAPAAAVA